MDLHEIINSRNCSIVDVRTRAEFQSGHAIGSINIPLQEITTRMEEFNQLPQPIVLCCASGGRSGQAESYLISLGLDCINAGSWLNVNRIVNSKD